MDITHSWVVAIISPILDSRQVKLCGVKISGRLSKPLVQIFVDWEESPITIEACVKLTREIKDAFDIEERFPPDYRLEVSSPGIDAPLAELWQFRRNIGRTIQFGQVVHHDEAIILGVSSEGLVSLEGEEGRIVMPYEELAGAQVVLFPKKKSLAKRKRNEA